MRLVSPTGTTKNSPTAKASATTIVPAHMPPEISSSSSSSCALAERPSALKPIPSDSTSATTPRMIGRRSALCFLSTEVSGNSSTAISPRVLSGAPSGAGLRTATAQWPTPRIITPSRTAWPPTGASRWATSWSPSGATRAAAVLIERPRSALGGAGGAAAEAVDAAAGVHELLPARVERVAVRADLDVDLGLRRAGRELVAARAPHVGLDVFGVDSGLHRFTQCSVENTPQRAAGFARAGRLTRHGVRARRRDRGRLPAAQRARRRRPEASSALHVPARLLRGHLAPPAPRRARRPRGVLDPLLARHAAPAARGLAARALGLRRARRRPDRRAPR